MSGSLRSETAAPPPPGNRAGGVEGDPARGKAGRIARAILAGFDRHYALFRYNAQQAKSCYERGDWHGIRRLARDRITFYDQRVREGVQRIRSEFGASLEEESVWPQVRRDYVLLLAEHRRPELAETFFNTVCTKLLHRAYFRNDIIFVRPAVSTQYLDGDPASYRVYYPSQTGWSAALLQVMIDYGFACPFVDVERDLRLVLDAAREYLEADFAPAPDCQLQMLRSPFFRNKGAYLIGRLINDGEVVPVAVPLLKDARGRIYIDAVLFGTERLEALFNFSRAYFMVDMDVPSAYVRFLRTLMPTKPESELYSMLGLHKQGKTLFYRDLLDHLRHSSDRFVAAPGIKGMVMAVFTLPSFPYVFKVIKDKRSKDVTREFVQSQYNLVKAHDRVGRMADTWEYADVPFPRDRLDPALEAELRDVAPSILADDGDSLVIHHVYIERRMLPLNIHLEQADPAELERAVIEYGDAIRDMVSANIFPGDMLYKNFGVARQGRIVFYDYDEVAYVTDCNFRRIPPPRTPEDEMASEPWYAVGPHDIFPEEFATFLLGNPRIRAVFVKHHSDLLDAAWWQGKQRRIRLGLFDDVFPYPDALRFRHRLADGPRGDGSRAGTLRVDTAQAGAPQAGVPQADAPRADVPRADTRPALP